MMRPERNALRGVWEFLEEKADFFEGLAISSRNFQTPREVGEIFERKSKIFEKLPTSSKKSQTFEKLTDSSKICPISAEERSGLDSIPRARRNNKGPSCNVTAISQFPRMPYPGT